MHQSVIERINTSFRRTIDRDAQLQNAYLHIVAPSRGIGLHLCGGHSDRPLDPDQPNYWASVGKLFTATLVAQLHEAGELDFDDPIVRYLPPTLCDGLHVFKGREFTDDIRIRHLLNQSSGLPDHFWPLLKRLQDNPEFMITPLEAVTWARDNLKPVAPPGRKTYYTDTNYHLLGLIIEQVTGQAFHDALAERIFQPLGMSHSYMLHRSQPLEVSTLEPAGVFLDGVRITERPGYGGLDYSGGGVVGPGPEMIRFLQALVAGELIRPDTLKRMQSDKGRLYPGIDYGYAIWQFVPIPLIMPRRLACWGVAGASGAFLFHHPELQTYIAGSFNDARYRQKALRFMLRMINIIHRHTP